MKRTITILLIALILACAIIWKKQSKPQSGLPSSSIQTLERKDGDTVAAQALIPKKSTAELQTEANAYEPNGESLDHFEKQYEHLSEKDLRQEIEILKLRLEDQIKTANSRRLSSEELTHLTEGIRKKVALQKILLDRKLQEVEAKL
jgi:hypothetical protein